MGKKVFFKTFGCRTNIFDTNIMIESLKSFSLAKDETEADVIVINSCTVTNSADSNIRYYINKIPKNKKVVLCGCGVWSKGEELYKNKKVDIVFGASLKEKIDDILKEDTFFDKGDLNHLDSTIVTNLEGKTKAFVKIQEGCDFSCSYCIIPSVRGKSRSYDENHILQQVKILIDNGFSEFVLTGTNLGSYGKSTNVNYKQKDRFAELIRKIIILKGVKRVRLGSIEPIQITKSFKELLDEDKLAKHLHIALQHTNEEMLKIMNRRNSLKKDLELFEFLNDKGYALGTDFIIGHPGENEKRFENGFKNLSKFPLTHIHIFSYSKRDGTKSATMENSIDKNIIKQRYDKIKNLIDEKNYNFRVKHNKNLFVLVEQYKNRYYLGYDQYFNQIKIKSDLDIKYNWVNLHNSEVKKNETIAFYK